MSNVPSTMNFPSLTTALQEKFVFPAVNLPPSKTKIAGLGAFCCMFALASRMYTSPPGSTASVAWPIVTEASSVSLPAT